MKSVIGGIISAGFVILAGSVAFGSWYTIDQGEKGVLLTNGALTAVVDPGLHFKMPFFQSVAKISTRQHVVYWTCVPTAQKCNDGERLQMQAYSRDQQPADMRVTVNFHVPADEIANVYSTYGSVDALADRIIARKAPQEVKTVFGQYDMVSVIQSREKFNNEVTKRVMSVVDGPVMIDSVQVENIDFSDAVEAAIEARMTAQVEVQKQEQTLQQEKIKAQITVTQAQAQADSQLAVARANATAIEVRGKAEATAIEARGNALRDNPSVVSLVQAEKWDGKLPSQMIPGSTVPFLSLQPATQ